jgi:hypothetical protein
MIRLTVLLATLWLASAAAVAAPVTRSCEVRGWKRDIYAPPVTLTVDEATRTVTTSLPNGWTATYHDGMTGWVLERYGEAIAEGAQFVIIKRDIIEVGWRSPEDETLAHFAYFNRSAIKTLAAPCLLRSFWWFGQG